MWQRAKTGGRSSLASLSSIDRFWTWSAPNPLAEHSNKVGSEAFWPTTLDKECDKAARILRSFCKDGFHIRSSSSSLSSLSTSSSTTLDAPKHSQKALKRLPEEVIRNARGLAIFTTMRSGLWVSGAGGSGVLVTRLPDGTWSPPSAILLHTDGVAFLVDADIYDCILIINTDDAMKTISQGRYTIGSGIGVTSGPVVSGDFLDSNIFGISAPIYSYLKSRGQCTDGQLNGTIVVERMDENERFYRRKVTAADILSGKIHKAPSETAKLIQTIKAAQGDTDVDPSMLPIEGAPSDFDLADGGVFGVPNKEDPDPFGFLALEKEGLVVREAGSQKRVSVDSFHFNPSPNSPLFNSFNRGGAEGSTSPRSSWRTSVTERSMQTMDMATQTDVDFSLPSPPHSSPFRASMTSIPEAQIPSIEQKLINEETTGTETSTLIVNVEHTDDILTPTPFKQAMSMGVQTDEKAPQDVYSPEASEHEKSPKIKQETTPIAEALQIVDQPIQPNQTEDSDADDEDADEDDDIVIHAVIHAAAPKIVTVTPQIITKARLVTVSKPPPPPALPPRNPIRNVVPRTPSPSLTPFKAHRSPKSEGSPDGEIRPTSSCASSVYSLKKDETPFSAGATESLGSISSIDDGDLVRATNLDASLDKIGIALTKEHYELPSRKKEDSTPHPEIQKVNVTKIPLYEGK
jgi:lipid-binding SYLF domain-containing protein